MSYKAFPPAFLEQIKRTTLAAMQKSQGPHYAAFDADGTLWDSDLGEQFFQHQIDYCNLETLKDVDPWHYYETTKAVDPVKAYLWLAQISVGLPLTQIRAWALDAVKRNPPKLFQPQKELIAWLQAQGIEVFIVTASIQWAVEPAAEQMGIPFENVLGIQTHLDDKGLITARQKGVITWRDGKAQALLERTHQVRPVFCAGNTYGDIALLESSVGGRLCIQTQTEPNGLFEEERRLREHASRLNWPIHSFR